MGNGSNPSLERWLLEGVRTIADWPKPGVMFKDITPLFHDADRFRRMVDALARRHAGSQAQSVAGIDARGFMLGAALAYAMGLGFVPIRKVGKLPGETLREDYALEYGQASVEIHADACAPGTRVVLVDDLIATGGTMLAGARLLQRLGAEVIEAVAIIDLSDLGGSERLARAGFRTYSLLVVTSD
ncbi:MAG: adenine phosphoribosyltransferase [Betaproteobacteria bacterium]|nr:adenine phosphoribosyltransferase [Betaproteobacteria bacterium]